MVENPTESTSFVDVKLDDIYNGSISSTLNDNGPALVDQSLHGFSVFNADSDPEITNGLHGANGQSNWPTTWQALVNEYNRQNSIHTPMGYDLMAAPKHSDTTQTPNGVIKAEDLERESKNAAPTVNDGSLHTLLGSKQLTCGDKLNFLFSFASAKQQQESSGSVCSSMSGNSPVANKSTNYQVSFVARLIF